MSTDTKENQFMKIYSNLLEILYTGTGLIFIFAIMIGIAILVAYLGNNNDMSVSEFKQDQEKVNNLFIILFIGIIVIIVIMGGLRYYFGTDVYAYINDLFGPELEIDVVINHKTVKPVEEEKSDEDYELPKEEPVEPLREQVFNIPENYYNYESAKNLCAAYDSRLATYEEIEDAYENMNGVIMDGLMDKWLFSLPNHQLMLNFKELKATKTIVDDQV